MHLGIITSHPLAALLLLLRCSLTVQHHLGLPSENLKNNAISLLGMTEERSTQPWETKNSLMNTGFGFHRIKRFVNGEDAKSTGPAFVNPKGHRDPSKPPPKVIKLDKIEATRNKEINWAAVRETFRRNKVKSSPSSPSTRVQTVSGGSSTSNCGRFQQWCPPVSSQHRPTRPVVRFPIFPGQGSSTSHIHVEPRPSVPSVLSSQIYQPHTVVLFPPSTVSQSNHQHVASSFPLASAQTFNTHSQRSSTPHFHTHHRPRGVGRSGS